MLEEGEEPGLEGGVRTVEVHRSVEIGCDFEGSEGREGGSGIEVGSEDLGDKRNAEREASKSFSERLGLEKRDSPCSCTKPRSGSRSS